MHSRGEITKPTLFTAQSYLKSSGLHILWTPTTNSKLQNINNNKNKPNALCKTIQQPLFYYFVNSSIFIIINFHFFNFFYRLSIFYFFSTSSLDYIHRVSTLDFFFLTRLKFVFS